MSQSGWYLYKPWGKSTTKYDIEPEELWLNDDIGDLHKTVNGWEFLHAGDMSESRYFFGTIENAQKMAEQFMADAKAQGIDPFDMPSQPNIDGWIESGNDFGGKTLWRHPYYGDLYVGNKSGQVTDYRPADPVFKNTHYARPQKWGSFKSFAEARKQIPDIISRAVMSGRVPWADEIEAGKEKLAAERAVSRAAETPVKPAAAAAPGAFAGQRIIIIPCSATKNPVSGPTPARDLYTGSNFQGNLKAAIAQVGEANVRIMSAKHGLLTLDEKIEPYDVKMGSKESISQSQAKQVKLTQQLQDLQGAQIETMLPQQYLKVLQKQAQFVQGPQINFTVDHFAGSRGIGDQRSTAKKLLGLGTNPVPPMPKVTLGKAKPVEAPVPVAKTDAQKVAEIAQHYLDKPDALVGRGGVVRTTDPYVVATDPTAVHHPQGLLAAIRVGLDRGDDKKVLLKALNALYKLNTIQFEHITGIPKKEFPKKLEERLAFAEKIVADKQYEFLFGKKPEPEPEPTPPSWMTDRSPMSPGEAESSAFRYVRYDDIYDDVPPELKSLIDRKREILKQYNPLEEKLNGVWRRPKENWDAAAAELGLTPEIEQYKAFREQLGYLESQIQYVRIGLPAPPAPKGMFDTPTLAAATTPTQVAASQMAEQIVADDPVLAAYKQRYPQIPGWQKMESFQRPGEFAWTPDYGPENSRSPSFQKEKYFGDNQFYTQFYTPAHETRLKYLMDKYPGVTLHQPLNVSEKNLTFFG